MVQEFFHTQMPALQQSPSKVSSGTNGGMRLQLKDKKLASCLPFIGVTLLKKSHNNGHAHPEPLTSYHEINIVHIVCH